MNKFSKKKGFSLLELLLAIAMFAIFSLGFGVVISRGADMNVLADEGAVANQYASEGIEAVRSIKNQNYALLVNSTSTGVVQTAGLWAFGGTSNTFDKYTRVIKVEAVNRSGGNIVTSGGALDPDTKKITSTVTWLNKSSRAETLTLSTYLTNWRISIVTAPTPSVIPTLPPPPTSWGSSSTISTTFDLTVANSGHATADGLSIAYANNKVYLGRANNSGSEFYIFDVTTPDSPTLLARRDLLGSPNDIVINGNYAYIASTDNVSELQILDISNPATIGNAGKLTSIDLTTANSGDNNSDPIKLFMSNSYLYMLRNVGNGKDFLVFDLSNPANPGAPIGISTGLVATVTNMVISGEYAYITSTSNADELQVVSLATKTAPTKIFSLDLNSTNNNADGLSIALAGNYVLVGRQASPAPELYSIDISAPTTPTLVSTMEVGFNVTELAVDASAKSIFLSTNDNAGQLKIANYTALTTLPTTFVKTFNTGGIINDFVLGLNRLFMASASDTGEFQVVSP